MTGAFLTRLDLYELEGRNGEWWCLIDDLRYQDEDSTIYTAPAGTLTNFASVPRPLWSLFPRYGKHTRAAVIHDSLCQTKPFPSPLVHGIFKRALQVCQVKTWMIWWASVRMFGPRF